MQIVEGLQEDNGKASCLIRAKSIRGFTRELKRNGLEVEVIEDPNIPKFWGRKMVMVEGVFEGTSKHRKLLTIASRWGANAGVQN